MSASRIGFSFARDGGPGLPIQRARSRSFRLFTFAAIASLIGSVFAVVAFARACCRHHHADVGRRGYWRWRRHG